MGPSPFCVLARLDKYEKSMTAFLPISLPHLLTKLKYSNNFFAVVPETFLLLS